MSLIVLRNPDIALGIDASHYTLRSNGRIIARLPPCKMGELVVSHRVEVTRPALDRLATHGVPTSFLDGEGRLRARLVPAWAHDAAPRLEQARIWFNCDARLDFAREIVVAKVLNAVALLRAHRSNHTHETLARVEDDLRSAIQVIRTATDLESLRGHEGRCAKRYFDAFAIMLRSDWTSFAARTRRPPLDPVNATLSYVYAVLTYRIMAYVESLGLDPYVGYLHATEPRRPNLALDLVEAFRAPLADRLTLRLFNLRMLRREHFENPTPGHAATFLNAEGRNILLETMTSWLSACDAELGDDYPAPDSLLVAECERFRKHAQSGSLDTFRPYLTKPADDAF